MKQIEIELYTTNNQECPFEKWIRSLTTRTRAIIHKRMARLEAGNFGDAKRIKGTRGLYELRIHEGPGYRIYFGKKREVLVILLCGGKKGSQSQDILKAKQYWQDDTENHQE